MASSSGVPTVNAISEDGVIKQADDLFNGQVPITPEKQRSPYVTRDDTDLSTELQSATSPSQARRALEAHLKETDRRLEEASKIGTSLVQQRQELADRLKEVEKQSTEREIGPELKQKLIDIEKEYNHLSRDSARAFLAPKARLVSAEEKSNGGTTIDPVRSASPTKFTSLATDSPSKVNVPQRKARNQTNKVHDIEFATEISSSLLSQVRQLQAALSEKDESLRALTLEKAQLDADTQNFTQRLRNMDENEQRYKDENWTLETQTHELLAAAKDAASREQKLKQSLAVTISDKTSAQRELDDFKSAHGKLNDEHVALRKSYDAQIAVLHKDVATTEADRRILQRRIEDLTSQNQELARAMDVRMKTGEEINTGEAGAEPDEFSLDRSEPEHSPPPSPSKGPTRNSMLLQQETTKSALTHAQRMIQKLKSDVHREKSEKLELKRLLQESRDELDERRADVSNGKRTRQKAQELGKKGSRIGQLGAARGSRTEIETQDPEWEEQDVDATPKRVATVAAIDDDIKSSDTSDAYQTANETEDAFETANEKETTTESEAFHTGAENMADDSSDDLTETESGPTRHGTVRQSNMTSSFVAPNKRNSIISTASTSDGDEPREVKTPVQSTLSKMKYRLRMGRGSRRSRVNSEEPEGTPRSSKDSPASFISNKGSKSQSLAAELGDLEADSGDDMDVTPSGTPKRTISQRSTPARQMVTATPPPPMPKISMVSASMMTDPWEPEAKPLMVATSPSMAKETRDQAVQGTPTTSTRDLVAAYESRDAAVQRSPSTGPEKSSGIGTGADNSSALSTSDLLSQVAPSQELISAATVELPSKPRFAPKLSFSQITSVDTEPSEIVKDKERPQTAIYSNNLEETKVSNEEDNAQDAAAAGVIGSVLGWAMGKRQSMPPVAEQITEHTADKTAQDPFNSKDIIQDPEPQKTEQAGTEVQDKRAPLQELSANAVTGPQIKDTHVKSLEKTDQSSQTTLSSDQIDSLLNKNSRAPVMSGAAPSSSPPPYIGRLREGPPPSKSARRPGSSSSIRTSTVDAPPLPADHRQAIEAASQRASSQRLAGVMGPPTVPASAYRASMRRPVTPNDQSGSPQVGGTPTTPRHRYSSARSVRSRRSSVSSFESEIDARFNIRTDGMSAAAIDGGTDPRMIQAITQTMIGEYLWKYTRKAGRVDMSSNRHRRFFWVHPYTRTLYWSDQDPSTAGRAQLKAKSVAIESITVVGDDNPMPPGLHRKSIVVKTPGREIKFTASTGQRHETWFNAMSYLLLRSGNEVQDMGQFTSEEAGDFRSGAPNYPRHSTASRTSLSTYNSRTNTTRRSRASSIAESPSRGSVRRISEATVQPSTPNRATRSKHASVASRISGYWRPSSDNPASEIQRESAGGGSIYDASVVNDSAEDVRQILEKQDEDADQLENVRACCDGKHDVSSLNRRSGFTGRIGSQGSRHSHTH